jgi:LAO/AO transport system kinase
MEELSRQDSAFIRPSPTSGFLGGINLNTSEVITLCEHIGYDVIIVETVGIGQSEVAIDEVTDFCIYIIPPGAGDDL